MLSPSPELPRKSRYACMIAMLAGLGGTSTAIAGSVFSPFMDPAAVEDYRAFLRSNFEEEQVLGEGGDRFTDPPQIFGSACRNPNQSNAGAGRVPVVNRVNAFAIFWSYLPDGTSIEGSPPTGLVGIGQTQDPVDESSMPPWDPFSIEWMRTRIFQDLSGQISPFGFGDLGGQAAWQSIVARAFDRWDEICGANFFFVGGNRVATQPNPDSGNPWDVSAPGWPPNMGGGGGGGGGNVAAEGDIRITMTSLDGTSNPETGNGSIHAYVYPVGLLPDGDRDDMPMQMDPTQTNCTWGYMGNIILDADERWTDPATPDLFDIVITRAVGEAIGLLPVCAHDPTQPFSIMEHQPLFQPVPVLFFTELQEDDIRAAQNLYGDSFEPNDTAPSATEISFSIPPGSNSFVFAPHLMIPPTSEIETPLPLSIANSPALIGIGDPSLRDEDKFRVSVPPSISGGFTIEVDAQPFGSIIDEDRFIANSSVGITRGSCNSAFNSEIDTGRVQPLDITLEHFDPFTNNFSFVSNVAAAAGDPVELIEDIDEGIYFITIRGDTGPIPQLYNLTIEIKPIFAESGLDVMPLLDLVEVQEFDNAGFTGTGANYAVLDGLIASEQHNTFGGQPRSTVAWSGAGAATTQIGAHATTVAALAIGDMDPGFGFRGVAPDASYYSGAVASQIFEDNSFAVSKTALYFALFGLSDPAMASQIGLPGTAGVINSVFSGGGRSLTGDDSISQAYDAAVSMHNVTIVAAAGNNGVADPACRGVVFGDFDPGARFLGSRSIVPPATGANIISVGAAGSSDPFGVDPLYDVVANFSSRGPVDTTTFDGTGTINNDVRGGVDLVAPGTGLTNFPADFTPPGGTPLPRCAYVGAAPQAFLRVPSIDPNDDPNNIVDTDFIAPAQGTSMASAVVAGAVALLQDVASANEYADHPAVMKSVLMTGAEKLAGWTNNPGDAPAKPQDTRDGNDIRVLVIAGGTQPLDVAQGAGVMNFRKSLEIFHSGYLPASEESFVFAGPPTIDPPETDPNVPTMLTPPDPMGTLSVVGPGDAAIDDSGSTGSWTTEDGQAMTSTEYTTSGVIEEEQPLSPIEIHRRLSESFGDDRGEWIGHSLQFGGGKSGDLKPGRGLNPPPFTTGPTVPFKLPAIGRNNPAGGGGGGEFPGLPGTGQSGVNPTFIDKIDVRPVGWDFGNIDQTTFVNNTGGNTTTGFIDYLIEVPLLPPRLDPQDQSMLLPADQLTVTLSWLRKITVEGINFQSPSDPRIGAVTRLEHENLDLLVFQADALGNPLNGQPPVASSVSIWDNVEHVDFAIPVEGLYLIRVQWIGTNYDLFANEPLAETQFGLSWRVEFSKRQESAASTGFADLINVVEHWGGRGSNGLYDVEADFTKDGAINYNDLRTVINNWNRN